MRSVFTGYRAPAGRQAPAIRLAPAEIDETAPSGTQVGVLTAPGNGWTLRLADDGGGRFALAGGSLVVGPTALNHDAAPSPAVLVAATDGLRATASRLVVEVRRPLPALPLPLGARIAAIGDSLIGYGNYGGTPIPAADKAVGSLAYGFIEQALAIDPRFDFDSWYDTSDPTGRNVSGANQGIFGDHLDWQRPEFGNGILGRLPAVLARKPQLLILEGGSNTISTGDVTGGAVPGSVSYVTNRLDRALRLARKAGVPVILVTIFPRGDWPIGDPRHATVIAVNQWIRAQVSRSGVVGICDPFALLAPEGVFDPALYMQDKVHIGPRGAILVGRDHLLPLVRTAVSAGSTFDQDPAAASLLTAAQARMQGTTGSRGTRVTGSVATGYTVNAVRNVLSVICSKETVDGAIEAQVLDIAGNPDGTDGGAFAQVDVVLPTAILTGPTAGKWYRVALRVETSGPERLSGAQMAYSLRAGSTTVAAARTLQTFSSDLTTAIPGNRGWWLRSKPFRAPDAASYDRIVQTLTLYHLKAADAFRVKLSRVIVREVADPRPAWGYV